MKSRRAFRNRTVRRQTAFPLQVLHDGPHPAEHSCRVNLTTSDGRGADTVGFRSPKQS
ncbi:MAG: hypothetical protein HQL69_18265 [Magnetococcales bacterium]|nr:hypothetical protein [Magnetococcales bacterium]